MTCDRCFNNRHVRCEDRESCSCTVCNKTTNKVSKVVPIPVPPQLKERKWDGERDRNGRTEDQQRHYNELQKQRRREKRGDPEWLTDKPLLVEKIQALFARLEVAP